MKQKKVHYLFGQRALGIKGEPRTGRAGAGEIARLVRKVFNATNIVDRRECQNHLIRAHEELDAAEPFETGNGNV